MFKSLVTLSLLAVASAQQGLLTVTEPSTAHWWIAQSLNTLAWSAQSGAPTTFSVFLNNPDPSVLTSKYALVSVQPLYEYSKTINPGQMKPATGYTIELTDTLNSSNIYATSEVFEIKAVNSPYPPQSSAPNTSGVVSVSRAAASGSSPSSSASAAASSKGAATPANAANFGLAGAAILGGLGLLL
ncbi:hypothetical protein DB88DRAFT_275701 [Papiliotrema laurentii]|uniref:Ser-Thr-rich glycosyl-phosphatidyl-inositol-anchored membrane family-domain-containing protein n=1 Tax=Papiliotrema laurentii TaxID=5418 RepID=A0AAD9FM19_PAPLA|nr:hypothetical protein DB88DRAFT_275701 [Papiliotrema laurentii]